MTTPESEVGWIPDLPDFTIDAIEDDWQALDIWQRQTDSAIAEHTAKLASLKEVHWQIYAERGRLLSMAERLYRKDRPLLVGRKLQTAWRRELAKLPVDPSLYTRYRQIAEDPEGTFQRSGGDISKVARRPRKKNAGAATISEKPLDEVIGALGSGRVVPCGPCGKLKHLRQLLHDRSFDCSSCPEAERIDQDIEAKARLTELRADPLYGWMRKLVVQKGKYAGTIRKDSWVRERYGYNIDRIAQQEGFHDDEYNRFTESRLRLYREERNLGLKGKRRGVFQHGKYPTQPQLW